ncbi:carbohydrate ABC transporter permease [Paenibacillus sp. J5C_2022]|uniref:carbohydrate ABC transporter permease n=1 Tax=Paenibacillus sp. J5C2022 TaxID=2977129 RepID=UPI0021D3D3B7|nr:carbohydrate ABC transporter permease [Paenibacillus sp. J5C2022]MCU6712029.1 carbohydrate ABC transporter permease [Paenibacillus sp. J5C2022]
MRTTTSEKLFYAANYAVLTAAALSCLLPLLHIIALSLSDSQSIMSGFVKFWPVGATLESYMLLLDGTPVVSGFKNSLIITVVGVLLSMLFTVMTAYPLSRTYCYARSQITFIIVFTMLFNGGVIPLFLVLKSLGLINTYGAIWLPGLVSTFNMLVMRTFFQNIPTELDDAARMDGCGEWRLLLSIYLSLSKPVLATLTLFYAVGFWNAFMNVLLFINDTHLLNLTVIVQQMVQNQSLLQEMISLQPEDVAAITPEGIKAAGIMIMIVPMLVVYPFLQKYFVKGVLIGSIKG